MSSAATADKEKSGLTLADVGKKSEMEGLGWSINQADDKTWSAHEKAGELRTIGPARSISALHTQLMTATGSNNGGGKKAVKVGSSKLADGEFKENSQPILSGTENAVFDDLTKMAVAYRQNTMDILEKQKLQKTQAKDLKPLLQKFAGELPANDDGEPFIEVFCEAEGRNVIVEIVKKETEELKTRAVEG